MKPVTESKVQSVPPEEPTTTAAAGTVRANRRRALKEKRARALAKADRLAAGQPGGLDDGQGNGAGRGRSIPREDGDRHGRYVDLLVPIEYDGKGGWKIRRPEELEFVPQGQLRSRIMDALAMLALRGDVAAARIWLGEVRWQVEMRKGKAPTRGRMDHEVAVRVVDDLRTGTVRMKGGKPRELPSARMTPQDAVVDVESAMLSPVS